MNILLRFLCGYPGTPTFPASQPPTLGKQPRLPPCCHVHGIFGPLEKHSGLVFAQGEANNMLQVTQQGVLMWSLKHEKDQLVICTVYALTKVFLYYALIPMEVRVLISSSILPRPAMNPAC